MIIYEALVHVVDPVSFVKEAFGKRNDVFSAVTEIEPADLEGPRTVSAPGEVMSIRSRYRLNVEDVLIVDVGMDMHEAASFIKTVRLSRQVG